MGLAAGIFLCGAGGHATLFPEQVTHNLFVGVFAGGVSEIKI